MENRKKTWTDNLIKFIKTAEPGACPKCGGNHIVVHEYTIRDYRSVTFRCEDCGAGVHVDGTNNNEEGQS